MSAFTGTAVVTGGATGIGFAITSRLVADGASVVVCGLDEATAKSAVDRLDAGGRVAPFGGDLSLAGEAERLLEVAVDAFGGADVLVNNAGGGHIKPTLEHTEETLQATIANNLWTNLRASLAFLPHFIERGGGRIISIGAESVRNGLTDHAVYNAAKGGVHGLATGLAREFAPHGVTVNVVAPSYTRTPELDAALASGRVPERLHKVVDDAVNLIPLARPADAADIAGAVAWLAGPDAGFVTGQVISVNGGSSML